MKKLILRYFKPMDDKVSFKIVEQTHRCNDFGNGDNTFGNGNNTFRGSNGMNIGSVSCPAMSFNNRKLYCRGEDIGSDDNIVTATITITEWNKIKEAVKEYNEYFGYYGECILGDPDEIIGDIVPKEMFMVD